MSANEGPNLSNRRKSSPKPPPDYGQDSAEVLPREAKSSAPSNNGRSRNFVPFSTRITTEAKEALRAAAFKQNRPITEIVEDAIRRELNLDI
ncbi:hypothetical protein [Corynebacterium sanguinis]|uniref:hypothetical protein n=1 Tax=Corynebacterium sanguinis TaxID=2594913 RepID=UPI0011AABC9F|nr:hypothetical protein [Corynebacterium sanguinis]